MVYCISTILMYKCKSIYAWITFILLTKTGISMQFNCTKNLFWLKLSNETSTFAADLKFVLYVVYFQYDLVRSDSVVHVLLGIVIGSMNSRTFSCSWISKKEKNISEIFLSVNINVTMKICFVRVVCLLNL